MPSGVFQRLRQVYANLQRYGSKLWQTLFFRFGLVLNLKRTRPIRFVLSVFGDHLLTFRPRVPEREASTVSAVLCGPKGAWQ